MPQQTTVILNSKVLFGESEVVDYINGHSSQFQLVLTQRITKEYEKEIYSSSLVQTRLIGLGKCVIKKKPAKLNREQIPGLRKHHDSFVLDACSAQCDYLVTKRQQWLELNSVLREMNCRLKIVTPKQFIEEVMQESHRIL